MESDGGASAGSAASTPATLRRGSSGALRAPHRPSAQALRAAVCRALSTAPGTGKRTTDVAVVLI